MKTYHVVFKTVLFGIAVLLGAGCSGADPTNGVPESSEEVGSTVQAFTRSAAATCDSIYVNANKDWIEDAVGYNCRRRNGSINPYTYYRGWCIHDLQNCNGALMCDQC